MSEVRQVRMGADIGGTFTDIVLEIADQIFSTKILTTYDAPERAIIEPDTFHMSARLAKELRQGRWSFSLNRCFDDVIQGCASERGAHGTWITADMMAAYKRLHTAGYAHSIESWCDGEFAGGMYGVRLGRFFFG